MQDITPLVTKIAESKAKLDPLEGAIKPLKDELDQVKFELMLAMQHSKSKRTEAIDGYYVVRAERKTVTIVDESSVTNWLQENNFDLADYLELNTTRVKATATSAMKENGEVIPVIEFNSTEYLTVREAYNG